MQTSVRRIGHDIAYMVMEKPSSITIMILPLLFVGKTKPTKRNSLEAQ